MISQLTLFSALAWAADVEPAAASAGQASPYSTLIMFGAIILAMYFLMIRPQSKRQKEHQAMLSTIQKGDRIQNNGGIFGTVTGVDSEKNELTVEIAPQVRVKIGRGFVARVIRPGDDKAQAPKDGKDKGKDKK
ncbi:MAG: preprotein translocase subunit YajC [Candidatus Adiutrix sp.]|jgi:preprotein translocase subunit YajC|nr:preprotein translocase subunit YajC [Candidatus Adiutrix sp.]